MSSKVWFLDHEDLFMSLPLHTTKINFHPDCREFGITVTLKPHQVEGVSSLIYKYLLSVNVLLGNYPPFFFQYKPKLKNLNQLFQLFYYDCRIRGTTTFFPKRYLCDCIHVESNLQIEQMGLGKTLQAIYFLSYLKFHQGLRRPFCESNEICFLKTSSWCCVFIFGSCALSFERNGWLGWRDKRFTPEHEVLRYVGDKDCHRNFRKVMHDYVNKNSKGLSAVCNYIVLFVSFQESFTI